MRKTQASGRFLVLSTLLLALAACSNNPSAILDTPTAKTILDGPSINLAGEHRSAEAQARDKYRNPAETLAFFGLRADMTVVEILPGGGWYTDVIAPFVADNGQYYGAGYAADIEGQPEYRYKLTKEFAEKINSKRALYGDAKITAIAPPTHTDIAPAGTADLIVSFRNFHGMLREDTGAYMQAIVTALKPGGVFGVVQHRAAADAELDAMKSSGYVSEQTVIEFATAAGLELSGRSEINANSLDTKNYEKGVWTLPPTYRLGDKNREKYAAIGESDRMTLKFSKPK